MRAVDVSWSDRGDPARLARRTARAGWVLLLSGRDRVGRELFEAILHTIASARPELGVIRLRVLPVFCDRPLGPPEGLQYESRVFRCDSAGATGFTADLHSADPRLWLRHHVAYDLRDALRRVVEGELAPLAGEGMEDGGRGHTATGEFIRRFVTALRSPQARELGEHTFTFGLCCAIQQLLQRGTAGVAPGANAEAVLDDLRRELPMPRPLDWPLGQVVNPLYDAPRDAGPWACGVSTYSWDRAMRR